jgi:hypothetical protein
MFRCGSSGTRMKTAPCEWTLGACVFRGPSQARSHEWLALAAGMFQRFHPTDPRQRLIGPAATTPLGLAGTLIFTPVLSFFRAHGFLLRTVPVPSFGDVFLPVVLLSPDLDGAFALAFVSSTPLVRPSHLRYWWPWHPYTLH